MSVYIRQNLFQLLLNIARGDRCEKVMVATFGSIASGLDTPTSDIDLVLKVHTNLKCA